MPLAAFTKDGDLLLRLTKDEPAYRAVALGAAEHAKTGGLAELLEAYQMGAMGLGDADRYKTGVFKDQAGRRYRLERGIRVPLGLDDEERGQKGQGAGAAGAKVTINGKPVEVVKADADNKLVKVKDETGREKVVSADQLGGGEAGAGQWSNKVTPEQFVEFRNQSKRAGFMCPLVPDSLKGHKLYIAQDGKVGFAMDSEQDIGNVFNNGGAKGSGADAVMQAVKDGGKTLDCYDGHLPAFYSQMGFVETGRMKFNKDFAPPAWDHAKNDSPDIIFMAHQDTGEDPAAQLARAKGPKSEWKERTRGTNYYADTEWDKAKTDSRRKGGPGDGAQAGAEPGVAGKALVPDTGAGARSGGDRPAEPGVSGGGKETATAAPARKADLNAPITQEKTTPPPPAKKKKPLYDPDPTVDSTGNGVTDYSRVGVPPDSTPPPPPIGLLPNLTKDERKVERRWNADFEKDPQKFVDAYTEGMNTVVGTDKHGNPKYAIGDAPNIFSTDDVKMLSDVYNPPPEAGLTPEEVNTQRSLYNTMLHQTANAIAKRSFLQYLDKLPADKKTVLVTAGGVAAGKDYAIGKVAAIGNIAKEAGAVWNAAGEANSTENDWILKACKERGIKPTFVFVHADPHETWGNPERGVVERAGKKGRMVDAKLFAESYAIGARNFHAFHQREKDNAQFFLLDNTGKDPKELHEVPKDAREQNADELYEWAVGFLQSGENVNPAVKRGGTNGLRIWPKEKKEQMAAAAQKARRAPKRPAARPVTESVDTSGHEHKGKGPGGGQFVKQDGGGGGDGGDREAALKKAHASGYPARSWEKAKADFLGAGGTEKEFLADMEKLYGSTADLQTKYAAGKKFADLDDDLRWDIVEHIHDELFADTDVSLAILREVIDAIDPALHVSEASVKKLAAQRTHATSPSVVKQYAGQLKKGATFPPVLVDGEQFEDGGHRLAAYAKAGKSGIPTIDIGPLLRMDWEKEFGEPIENLKKREQLTESVDTSGHSHKGKGPGGGQFVKKDKGGESERPKSAGAKPIVSQYRTYGEHYSRPASNEDRERAESASMYTSGEFRRGPVAIHDKIAQRHIAYINKIGLDDESVLRPYIDQANKKLARSGNLHRLYIDAKGKLKTRFDPETALAAANAYADAAISKLRERGHFDYIIQPKILDGDRMIFSVQKTTKPRSVEESAGDAISGGDVASAPPSAATMTTPAAATTTTSSAAPAQVTEGAEAFGAKFTGEIVDKLGRHIHFFQGKRVKWRRDEGATSDYARQEKVASKEGAYAEAHERSPKLGGEDVEIVSYDPHFHRAKVQLPTGENVVVHESEIDFGEDQETRDLADLRSKINDEMPDSITSELDQNEWQHLSAEMHKAINDFYAIPDYQRGRQNPEAVRLNDRYQILLRDRTKLAELAAADAGDESGLVDFPPAEDEEPEEETEPDDSGGDDGEDYYHDRRRPQTDDEPDTGPPPPKSKKKPMKVARSEADVIDQAGADDELEELFPDIVDPEEARQELASVIGAPDDSEVKILRAGPYMTRYADDVQINAHGVRVFVLDDRLEECSFFIGIDKDGKRMIRLEMIKARETGTGLAREIVEKMIGNAAANGFDYVSLHAAGTSNSYDPETGRIKKGKFTGYYVWPVMGWDQSIEALRKSHRKSGLDLYDRIKEDWPDAERVRDIFLSRGGEEWWLKNGADLHDAKFDLTEGSWSHFRLDKYLDKRAKKKAKPVSESAEPPAAPAAPAAPEDPNERAELYADILYGLYGERALEHLNQGQNVQESWQVIEIGESFNDPNIDELLADIMEAATARAMVPRAPRAGKGPGQKTAAPPKPNFTGMIVDRLGRHQYYVNGVHVAGPGQIGKSSLQPPSGKGKLTATSGGAGQRAKAQAAAGGGLSATTPTSAPAAKPAAAPGSAKRAQKSTQEQLTAAKSAIAGVLSGKSGAAQPHEIMGHLDRLTVGHLRDLHKEHGLKAPGRLREQLVNSVKKRMAGQGEAEAPAAQAPAKVPANVAGEPVNVVANDPKAGLAKVQAQDGSEKVVKTAEVAVKPPEQMTVEPAAAEMPAARKAAAALAAKLGITEPAAPPPAKAAAAPPAPPPPPEPPPPPPEPPPEEPKKTPEEEALTKEYLGLVGKMWNPNISAEEKARFHELKPIISAMKKKRQAGGQSAQAPPAESEAPASTPAPAAKSEHGAKTLDLAHQSIQGSKLSDEQKSNYHGTLKDVVGRIHPNAMKKAEENIASFHWHENLDDMTQKVASMAKSGSVREVVDKGGKIGGAYTPSGKVFLNGGGKEGKAHAGFYAHELGHAIDGKKGARISEKDHWQAAWNEELKGGKLTKYAGHSPAEGFAEFSRFLHSGETTPDKVKKHFPKAYAVWESEGLV